MSKHGNKEIEALSFQIKRHEEVLTQLIEIVAATNKRLIKAIGN